MRRGAVAIVTATTSLTTKPTRMRMMGNHFLLSASGCPCLTMAQHTRSVSPIFSRALPAIVNIAPSSISTFPSHTPSLVRARESPRDPVLSVDCLRRRLLHQKPWIKRCHLTALTLADRPETSYRPWLRYLPSTIPTLLLLYSGNSGRLWWARSFFRPARATRRKHQPCWEDWWLYDSADQATFVPRDRL